MVIVTIDNYKSVTIVSPQSVHACNNIADKTNTIIPFNICYTNWYFTVIVLITKIDCNGEGISNSTCVTVSIIATLILMRSQFIRFVIFVSFEHYVLS